MDVGELHTPEDRNAGHTVPVAVAYVVVIFSPLLFYHVVSKAELCPQSDQDPAALNSFLCYSKAPAHDILLSTSIDVDLGRTACAHMHVIWKLRRFVMETPTEEQPQLSSRIPPRIESKTLATGRPTSVKTRTVTIAMGHALLRLCPDHVFRRAGAISSNHTVHFNSRDVDRWLGAFPVSEESPALHVRDESRAPMVGVH